MKISPCDYLVIGSGSIANRHISNLKILYPKSTIGNISSSGRLIANSEADIIYKDLLDLQGKINNFAIIASPANYHIEHAIPLMKYNVPLLIEKPISNSSHLDKFSEELIYKNLSVIDVGYNLRFNPALKKFKEIIEERKFLGEIFSVIAEVGQYLPDWRKNKDYKRSVSANRDLGGGALLELSHEIDYLTWIFGSVSSIFCKVSNTGFLDIDVEDNVDAILTTEKNININLHMDFLQRSPRRQCIVHGKKGTILLDLIANKIIFYGGKDKTKEIYNRPDFDKNKTYLEMIKYFDKVSKKKKNPEVGIKQAIDVVHLVEQMKISSSKKKIIRLNN